MATIERSINEITSIRSKWVKTPRATFRIRERFLSARDECESGLGSALRNIGRW